MGGATTNPSTIGTHSRPVTANTMNATSVTASIKKQITNQQFKIFGNKQSFQQDNTMAEKKFGNALLGAFA